MAHGCQLDSLVSTICNQARDEHISTYSRAKVIGPFDGNNNNDGDIANASSASTGGARSPLITGSDCEMDTLLQPVTRNNKDGKKEFNMSVKLNAAVAPTTTTTTTISAAAAVMDSTPTPSSETSVATTRPKFRKDVTQRQSLPPCSANRSSDFHLVSAGAFVSVSVSRFLFFLLCVNDGSFVCSLADYVSVLIINIVAGNYA